MKREIKLKRVMFVGDVHLSDRQPKNRLDNYCEAIKAKLTECLVLAEERELDAVGLLGDLFETF